MSRLTLLRAKAVDILTFVVMLISIDREAKKEIA